jgi:hypothetical protein
MKITQRLAMSLVASALMAAWALPAPAAEPPVAPARKVVKTAVKKPPRHRPIRLVASNWPIRSHGGASFLVLGVAY